MSSRNAHRLIAAVVLLGLVFAGCKDDGASPKPTAGTVAASATGPACQPLPPIDQWRSVGAAFFDARLPSSFIETKIEDGVGFRDDAARRRIQFSPIELPAGSMDLAASIDKLNDGVREQAADPELALKLGSTQRAGSSNEPVRYYSVRSRDRLFVQGLVGRMGSVSKFHAVLVIYEDDGQGAGESCLLADAKRILETVSLRRATGSSSASHGPVAPPAVVRFTPRAVAELRRELEPGEVVWLGVNVTGSNVSYLIDVGEEAPPDVERMDVEGIAVAIDRGSVEVLRGVTVDFVPGGGFAFLPSESR